MHNLDAARAFYGGVLGCEEGRSAATWIDWNLGGHQLVNHWVGDAYRGPKHINGVDKDMVPVPHFGLCLTVPEFHAFAAKLTSAKVPFLIEPHLRFEGKPGAQVRGEGGGGADPPARAPASPHAPSTSGRDSFFSLPDRLVMWSNSPIPGARRAQAVQCTRTPWGTAFARGGRTF